MRTSIDKVCGMKAHAPSRSLALLAGAGLVLSACGYTRHPLRPEQLAHPGQPLLGRPESGASAATTTGPQAPLASP